MMQLEYASPMARARFRDSAVAWALDALLGRPVDGRLRVVWYRPERRWVAQITLRDGQEVGARAQDLGATLRAVTEQVDAAVAA